MENKNTKHTIFVVDDDDMILSQVNAALKAHYNVVTISSAKQMFVLLKKIKPALIVLDVTMPEMDGFEALEKLKSEKEDIPIIFLTGIKNAAMESRAFNMGVKDFIEKPFTAPVLINRISLFVSQKGEGTGAEQN